jgi:hypothetical protein
MLLNQYNYLKTSELGFVTAINENYYFRQII